MFGSLVIVVSLFLPWFGGTGFTLNTSQPYTLHWDAFNSHAFFAVCILLVLIAMAATLVRARYRRPIEGRPQELGRALLIYLAGLAALGALFVLLSITNIPTLVSLYKDPHAIAGGYIALAGIAFIGCGVAELTLATLTRRRRAVKVAA